MSNPSGKPKPSKPYPGFPLFAHASGRWAKKIRGKLHYFGKWDVGADAALARYQRERDALHTGRTPVADTSGRLTVQEVCERFLEFKMGREEAGGLSPQLFKEYGAVARRLMAATGSKRLVSDLRADDFAKMRKAMEERWGVYRITNEIVRIKTIFRYAQGERLITELPHYGQAFRPPSRKDVRIHRASVGSRLFTADEIRKMIEAGGQPLKTMFLLGINAAFSNSDLANLPLDAIKDGWLIFARVKTGIPRRCPLWPETLAALQEWILVRPTPKRAEDARLVFVTCWGGDWRDGKNGAPITKEVRKVFDRVGIGGARGFYSLRRTFQNVAEETIDFLATRAIMGHAINDVSQLYRERISDERLKAVVEHVRKWLFQTPANMAATRG